MAAIVRDDAIRSGEPRVEGTRITVLDVKRRIVDGGEDARTVAEEYDLSMAAVSDALAYYDDHRDEFEARERAASAARRRGERRTRELIERAERSRVEPGDDGD